MTTVEQPIPAANEQPVTRPPRVFTGMAGAWALRVKEALESGILPAYSDLEEGIEDLLKKNETLFKLNDALTEFSQATHQVIDELCLARHLADTPKVLAILDDFMKSSVIVLGAPQAAN